MNINSSKFIIYFNYRLLYIPEEDLFLLLGLFVFLEI